MCIHEDQLLPQIVSYTEERLNFVKLYLMGCRFEKYTSHFLIIKFDFVAPGRRTIKKGKGRLWVLQHCCVGHIVLLPE